MRAITTRVLATTMIALLAGGALQAAVSAQSGEAPSGEAQGGAAPGEVARYRYLPAQVFDVPGGKIAVGAPSPRRVLVQHFDPATTSWDEPSTLYRREGVTCGAIDGRSSAGGVALLLQCDTPYYEDTAPVESVALVSADGETWARQVLPGEAYRDPAISPDGRYAAWLVADTGAFVEWSADGGFAPLARTAYRGDNGGETLVVADTGTVTVLGPESGNRRCVVGVHDRTLAGARSSTAVTGVDPGCTEGSLDNVDALTVTGGDDRQSGYVISRTDDASSWRLTTAAPIDGPGLRGYAGSPRRRIYTTFSDVPGQPLVAVGSPDRRRVYAQTYDEQAARWSEPTLIHDQGFPGCTSAGSAGDQPLRVHLVLLNCYPTERGDGDYPPYDDRFNALPRNERVALLSADGQTWRTRRIGARPVSFSPNGALVAVPGSNAVTVLSPTGLTRLPYREPSRCGFFVPIADDQVLRLHGGRDAAWPTQLQRRGARGWVTIQRVRMPATGTCRRVFAERVTSPATTFYLTGRTQQVSLKIKRVDGGYRAVRAPF